MIMEIGALYINSGRLDGLRQQGVGIVLSKTIKDSLISYSPISERLMTVRLYTKHVNISIIVAYAPTNEKDDAVKEEFYNLNNDKYDREQIRILVQEDHRAA